ncbi:unnamed protein product [marine sediment metagenome]|uniref:Uncharacterized protein n=1 Tax=marine sediment metagenome TaxID=412755 RepID=X1LWW8_9ZZZZ
MKIASPILTMETMNRRSSKMGGSVAPILKGMASRAAVAKLAEGPAIDGKGI